MKIDYCDQLSPEWFALKKGKIGGTRFGQVISGKKNRLIYDLLNERLSEFLFPDDFISDDMQFGIDNEADALKCYTLQTGIKVMRVGALLSDHSNIHIASPDGVSENFKIVQEVKSTQDGGIHIQRFFEGPETSYLPQIKNYFAVDDQVAEVHWISYCPSRPERPLVVKYFTRSQFKDDVDKGRALIHHIESELAIMENAFIF